VSEVATVSLRKAADASVLIVGVGAWQGLGAASARRFAAEAQRLAPLAVAVREDGMLDPDAIADAYWNLHHQHRSAWTLELDLRPWNESF
jgi:NAD(P)-dependent dehydrogenase (short-subunit alcohol dehydrogenase family)